MSKNRNQKGRASAKTKILTQPVFTCFGATTPEGVEMIGITDGRVTGYVTNADCRGNFGTRVVDKLSERFKLHVKGPQLQKDLVNQILDVNEFPPRALISKPGWTGNVFALRDGTVIAPEGTSGAVAIFPLDTSTRCGATGSIETWRDKVAAPLAGQNLPCFAMMLAFAPVILEDSGRADNYGFEIAGAGGRGKSTLQHLVSSVWGNPDRSNGPPYWSSMRTTSAALEQTMSVHQSGLLILDEANLFMPEASPSVRAQGFNKLAFELGEGFTKARWSQGQSEGYRFLYLTSSNEPLREVTAGTQADRAKAASDRLMTLPLRKGKVFYKIPKRYRDSGAFVSALRQAARDNYGHPIRHFVRGVVELREKDHQSFRARLRKYLEEFRELANVRGDGSLIRVADGFGLVYAAGRLAQALGVLPKSYDCRAAALSCYEGHMVMRSSRYIGRLLALAEHPDAVKVAPTPQRMSDSAFAKTSVFVRKFSQGLVDVMIRPKQFELLFPDWKDMLRDPEIRRLMARDGDHTTVKRTLRKGSVERVRCFRLKLT